MNTRADIHFGPIVIFLILGVVALLYSIAFLAPDGLVQKAGRSSSQFVMEQLPTENGQLPSLDIAPVDWNVDGKFGTCWGCFLTR